VDYTRFAFAHVELPAHYFLARVLLFYLHHCVGVFLRDVGNALYQYLHEQQVYQGFPRSLRFALRHGLVGIAHFYTLAGHQHHERLGLRFSVVGYDCVHACCGGLNFMGEAVEWGEVEGLGFLYFALPSLPLNSLKIF
jgi:hypothetical protein